MFVTMDTERYEELKKSMQELRSQVRTKAPRSSPEVVSNPKTSASMQLFQLQLDILDQARQEELLKVQTKVNEKAKLLEALKTRCEKKMKKSEDSYYTLRSQYRKLEADVCERLQALEEEFLNAQASMQMRCNELEAEQVEREHELTASYESRISSLEKKNSEKSISKKHVEDQLKRVMDENTDLRERIMRLELESRSAKEEFRRLYRDQEKAWNSKLQSVTETQESELESLKSAMEEERSKLEAEKEQLSSEFREYKAHKVKEIGCLEKHVRLALESKDANILKLKCELERLQQQLDQTNHMFQEIG